MTEPPQTDTAERSFEASMTELERCVQRLDAGDLPLEEALRCFEQGVALVQECHAKLDQAEQRIVELTEHSEGLEARSFHP
ncbi:MAG: exodeoxyribonuclease VII small subunit [Deltaproteobacteria bacterium]|nr:exodeoxyribonuclease VII small subunit [Deltaproteobacteria bacterium]